MLIVCLPHLITCRATIHLRERRSDRQGANMMSEPTADEGHPLREGTAAKPAPRTCSVSSSAPTGDSPIALMRLYNLVVAGHLPASAPLSACSRDWDEQDLSLRDRDDLKGRSARLDKAGPQFCTSPRLRGGTFRRREGYENLKTNRLDQLDSSAWN